VMDFFISHCRKFWFTIEEIERGRPRVTARQMDGDKSLLGHNLSMLDKVGSFQDCSGQEICTMPRLLAR